MKYRHLIAMSVIIFMTSGADSKQSVSSNTGSAASQDVQKSNRPRLRGVAIGKPFPALQFKDLDGRVVSIGKLKGQVVLIDFWATWCNPCTKETPNLLSIYKEFNDKGFEIIGISLDSNRQKLMEYVNKNGITWPNYFDGKGWDNKIASKLGVQSIPQTLLLDRQGIVREIGLRGDHIRGAVEQAIQSEQSADSIPPDRKKD